MQYTHRLVYDHPEVPRTMNNAKFDEAETDGGVQILSEANQEILEQIPHYVPPVIIKSDDVTGFYMEAAQDIPSLTLLCEYVGQVRTAFQSRTSTNDSIMELLCASGKNEQEQMKKSLVVMPSKYANIARFFNGINNRQKNSKKLK